MVSIHGTLEKYSASRPYFEKHWYRPYYSLGLEFSHELALLLKITISVGSA